jgi:oligoribonuclease (3'-5' exoribonuclease)
VEEGGNGLFADVEKSEHTLEMVASELIAFLERHITKGESRLGGFSIQCDIEVLRRRMPAVLPYFSHQIIDVSTILQLGRRWNMGRRTRHDTKNQDKTGQDETRQEQARPFQTRADQTRKVWSCQDQIRHDKT